MADELQNEREKANVMCLEAGLGEKAFKKRCFGDGHRPHSCMVP